MVRAFFKGFFTGVLHGLVYILLTLGFGAWLL